MKTRAQLKKQGRSAFSKDSKLVEPKKTKKQLLQEKNSKKGVVNDEENLSGKKKKIDEVPLRRSKRQNNKSVRVSDTDKPQAKQQPAKNQRLRKIESRESLKIKKQQQQRPRPRKKPAEKQQQTKKGQKQKEQKNSAKDDSKQQKQDAKQQIKTIQFKGKAPIDDHCNLKGGNNFVLQHGGKIYSCTLNQTSVSNNNNKFYILQIIQKQGKPNECFFFTRWGRVGVTGQQSIVGPYPPQVAIGLYNSKYHQKHIKGDYREVQLNYEEQQVKDKEEDKKEDNQEKSKKKEKKDFDQSMLASPVKKLIELIFDLNMMNNHMIQIGYNVKRMPLGRLSKQNILKGFNMLKQLMEEINGKKNANRIQELTNDFYSYIPHDFGFNKMRNYILDTEKKVKDKIQMLQSLNQIKVATSLIGGTNEEFENKIDSNYKKLNRDIQSIERNTEEFQIMNKYLKSTHAQTHTSYELELVDLFALSSDMQNERYKKDIDNKMLLWHGSRLTNFVGILSQGLRIAPPEAPVTGYMFGKGVYFADMSSKSANYCFTSRENNTGILLLCQVALGQMNEKLHADYYAGNLPVGKLSTKGLGRNAPNPQNAIKIQGNITVPLGPGVNTNIPGCSLLYNEFIVYDIAQIKVRYLLRTKFNYKKFH